MYLQTGGAVVQQLQHVLDVLCILDHEVQLHIEFSSHQLEQTDNIVKSKF